MNTVHDVLEEIESRIKELQMIEDECRRKRNINGRMNARTKREELERLKNVILGIH
ncbi:hypothetical protein GCM10023310_66280 [Paenibacillus vulneris]|uniref:Uncharacterized protein n=1 Tax=Paenibacillus vulneris TaxID=1133364 RepID=A0ABW3UH75_9BACL|nr:MULTISPECIES: hypothetical protein [unclassified Paenibacillus]MBE1442072.1 hypothetical protein [Paenibacillus sp. OAS669]